MSFGDVHLSSSTFHRVWEGETIPTLQRRKLSDISWAEELLGRSQGQDRKPVHLAPDSPRVQDWLSLPRTCIAEVSAASSSFQSHDNALERVFHQARHRFTEAVAP